MLVTRPTTDVTNTAASTQTTSAIAVKIAGILQKPMMLPSAEAKKEITAISASVGQGTQVIGTAAGTVG